MISPADRFNVSYQIDASDEPPSMRRLSDDQKEQLGELLERYMTAFESGLPPSLAELTKSCPDLREALADCVGGLESLHRMAGNGGAIIPTAPDSENTLGDFELHEEVGRGGMGVVYRATQRSLHRTVAIKLLPLTSVLDSRKLVRFQQEAEAAASLQHPNIVPVHAVGCERGIHFYAMQFIEGKSLEGCRVDWRTAVRQAIGIAEGLHAAHELGIVHRDIKPSNLIVDDTGKAWVTDFGLARIQSDVSLTQSGDVIGTMRYMSPEQARGESAIVDGRTDVYSLGATLYEMLTGYPAHDGQDAPAIMRQIDQQTITPMKRHRDDLPRDLQTVVAKAMSGRRDDRYETARAFAEDLRRVLHDEPTLARPQSILDHSVRLATKHRRPVAAAVMVGVLALAGFAFSNSRLAAEKKISDANLLLAQRNEDITSEAIDRLGSQIAELLGDIPAANLVRQRLLNETLAYYQRLVPSSTSDAPLDQEKQLDLATTYGKIGSFQGELGQNADAIESLTKSEAILKRLAQSASEDEKMALQWSISQNNLAQRLASAGDFESATSWFGKAIAIQQSLPASEPVTTELATTLNNFGQMLTESENVREAETVFGRAIELMVDSSPAFAPLRSTVQSNLAGLLARRAPSKAADLARQSLSMQFARLEADSSDAKTATQVVATLNTLATTQSAQELHAASIKTLQRAVNICQQLRSRWPDHPSYRRDLGISFNQLGLAYSSLGHSAKAHSYFEQAAEQARALTTRFPDDAEVHSMLGTVLNNAGFLCRTNGDHERAVEWFSQAIYHQRQAVELAPQVPRYQAYLQKHEHNLDELKGAT